MGWHLLFYFVLLLFVQHRGESVWQRKSWSSILSWPLAAETHAYLGKSQSRTGLLAFPEQHPESSKSGMWPDSETQDFSPISSLQLFVNKPLGLWPSQMNALRMQLKNTGMHRTEISPAHPSTYSTGSQKKCGNPGQSHSSNSPTQQWAM